MRGLLVDGIVQGGQQLLVKRWLLWWLLCMHVFFADERLHELCVGGGGCQRAILACTHIEHVHVPFALRLVVGWPWCGFGRAG